MTEVRRTVLMGDPPRSRSSGVLSRATNIRRKSYLAEDDERQNIVVSQWSDLPA